jgi:4-diphosphocytidyl-2-C-methyl-D-erythritol kinase
MLTVRAPAKVNLTLTVHGRRDDGYHDLTSLVVFAGVGDTLSLTPDASSGMSITGPFGEGLDTGPDNLVLRAAGRLFQRLGHPPRGHFALTKRLPVASGIGGGSADAAAALRLLAQVHDLALADPVLMAASRDSGADVPVCLMARARIMSGIGDSLGPPMRLPKLFALLVNPGVAVPTAAVFASLGLAPGQRYQPKADARLSSAVASWHEDWPEHSRGMIASLQSGHGNDLEGPAIRTAPVIGAVLDALRATEGCRLARMSGSGATCFGLFDDCASSARAARRIGRAHPDWWVKPTILR